MEVPRIGDKAPSLRLPSAQGSDVSLDDFRGRAPVAVWFSKGMACPFCRQMLSQVARVSDRIHGMGSELLYVTGTRLDRARSYARQFKLPYPYLCDPDRSARAAWGVETRSHSLPWYAAQLVKGMSMPKPTSDFGSLQPKPGDLPNLLADDDMGFFIVDREGIVRYALAGSYLVGYGVARGIPANEDILRELARAM